jgi:di/tricarboxylate transporter
VIAYALELSGLLDRLIAVAVVLCRRIGAAGLWLLIMISGSLSAFLNNTPIVVLGAPVVRDAALTLNLSPKSYLMPLSYMAVLGGCCTLIGTSTNLLVNDMARVSGQPTFGLFEITPVGLSIALAGALYLLLVSRRLIWIGGEKMSDARQPIGEPEVGDGGVGAAELFEEKQPFQPIKAFVALGIFVAVIAIAALEIAPIAASAFAGAVLLILLRVISADQAYGGLRPEILILIAGMVVIGIAMEESGLAASATRGMIGTLAPLGPTAALVLLYGATLLLTELLSNATVAVLVTPLAVALAESFGVSPRPFLVAVMMAGSAAFATPFGYQTNVIVYQMGGYAYMDFVRVGLPLNLLTWAVGIVAIRFFFPF